VRADEPRKRRATSWSVSERGDEAFLVFKRLFLAVSGLGKKQKIQPPPRAAAPR
jgi:hypothetical protein